MQCSSEGLVGCDKTTPSLLMGASSCDVPTLVVSGGPMLNGRFRGERIGSGTHVWQFDAMVKAGELTKEEFMESESCMSRSVGHCMTMGTASTMACMVEALGMGMPGNAAIPAADSRRQVLAHMAGRRIVDMVAEDLKPSDILTKQAFENAIRANGAIGGSTNAVIHLLAIAGRVGVEHSLDDWDEIGKNVPCLVNLMPSGEYLMEDFYYAGGLPTVLKQLGEANLLHKDVVTVNGKTMWDNVKDAQCYEKDVVFNIDKPFKEQGGLVVLRGKLAPNGAILKPSAATLTLDVENRSLNLNVSDDELEKRKANWKPIHPQADRGYVQLYQKTVMQADEGPLVFMANKRREPAERLLKLGATEVSSPAEMAAQTDAIILCVTTSEVVEDIVFRDDGIMAGIDHPLMLIDCGTSQPDSTLNIGQKLAEKNCTMLDVPLGLT